MLKFLLQGISIRKGDQIILKNELVDSDKWDKLRSLKQQFSSENLSGSNSFWILTGYAIIIMTLLLILLFIHLSISSSSL